MRSAGQIPLSRALDNARKEAAVRYSGTAANGATEMISPLIFHPAFPLLSPSNLRPFGAPPSIGRRECPHEPLPLEGAAERSEAGLAFFFGRRSGALVNDALETIPLCLPHWGRGTASAVDRVLSYIVDLRRIYPLIFHTASTLSGSLRSPPSPQGEGFVSRIALFSYHCLSHTGKAKKERRFAPIHICGEAAAKSLKAGIRD